MSDSTRMVFEHLGISLALGFLIGLQRQRAHSLLAGLRTFPLIAVLGTLAATIDQGSEEIVWMTPIGLVGLVVVLSVNNFHELRKEGADVGLTTESAILLMYLVGAYVVLGDRTVAIAVGVGVAVLLQFKPELHGIASRLGDDDLRAIMTFALISGIVLPLLPNQTYDVAAPLNVLNPFRIWLMVVLIVGISLAGYLIYKFLGRDAGVLLGGLLGGLVSSTATTVSYAKRALHWPASSSLAALVIVLASTVTYVRVLLEISVVAPTYFTDLAWPIALMLATSMAVVLPAWWRARDDSADLPQQKNPTELKSALVFASVFAVVLMALSLAKQYFGERSLYVVAVLSGLTDMDAITISTASLVESGPSEGGIEASMGWRLLVIAATSNLFFKWLLCLTLGNRALAWRVGALFAPPAIAAAAMIALAS